ncbi:uncharacterized protein C2845_PM01G07130 [Panicum miliaceum]|uniref:Uncharacterized protein n=1 Tax=Panicum miliaceum TaxID=4540 RepID=A0A3L6TKL6_PANMI|nr:uncharacterized protein C2845_PM01G07130 [Panicum miliaceum]
MPKRRSSESPDEDDDCRSRRPCPRCPPQRHLCVVLDDWSKGCSIYKLDVDGFNGDPDDPDLTCAPNASRACGSSALRSPSTTPATARFSPRLAA